MLRCFRDADNYESFKFPKRCTDLSGLVAFACMWIILIFLSSFAFTIGNPKRLKHAQDSFGNVCGTRNKPLDTLIYSGLDMTDKPYAFFLDIMNVDDSVKICVKVCPDEMLKTDFEIQYFQLQIEDKLCTYNLEEQHSRQFQDTKENSMKHQENSRLTQTGYELCAKPPILEMKPLVNHCIPTTIDNVSEAVTYSIYAQINSHDSVQQVVRDLYEAWLEVFIMILLSAMLSLVMLGFFMTTSVRTNCCPMGPSVIWSIIMFAIWGSSALVGLLWWTYFEVRENLDKTPFVQLLEESAKNERFLLCFSIISSVLLVILVVYVLTWIKQIPEAGVLLSEASKCIKTMQYLLIQPVWTLLVLMVFFFFWCLVLLDVATSNYPVTEERHIHLPNETDSRTFSHDMPVEGNLTLVTFNKHSWVCSMWWFHIVGLLWTTEFILSCEQLVVGGAVAKWYSVRKEKAEIKNPVSEVFCDVIYYHLGSAALGSFLITIFKFPRLLLKCLFRIMSLFMPSRCVDSLSSSIKSCKCCKQTISFVERCNHNAYPIIAYCGTNYGSYTNCGFFSASKEAERIATESMKKVQATGNLTDGVLFLGKTAITATSTFVGLLWMKQNPQLHLFTIPVLFGIVASFFIAHCVLTVYEMVLDTMLLCYSEDMAYPNSDYYQSPDALVKAFNGRTVIDPAIVEEASSQVQPVLSSSVTTTV